jgi:hypothetical protein
MGTYWIGWAGGRLGSGPVTGRISRRWPDGCGLPWRCLPTSAIGARDRDSSLCRYSRIAAMRFDPDRQSGFAVIRFPGTARPRCPELSPHFVTGENGSGLSHVGLVGDLLPLLGRVVWN